MKRSKSPLLVIYPGISPGLDVRPMAVMIRSPACFDTAREPHIAVLGGRLPRALAIEILVPDDIGRHISSRDGVVPTTVPAPAPRIKRILPSAVGLRIFNKFISAGKDVIFIGINRIRGSGAGDLALAAAHGYCGRGTGFIDSEAIHARLQDRKCKVRRVDLVSLIVVESTDPNQQRPDRELNLGDVIAQIEERRGRIAREPKSRAIQLQLCATALVRPNLVAGGDRSIERCCDPFVGTPGLK